MRIHIHELLSNACAFALLDVPSGGSKEAQLEMLYAFEAVLPQPVDEMQVVFSNPIDGKVVGCACDRKIVQGYRSTTEILIPQSVPEWLGIEITDSQRRQLNLLNGSMRPTSSLNRDRLTAKMICFASIAMLLMFVLGVNRRINTIESQRAIVDEQVAQMYDEILPRSTGPNTLPDAIRFAAMLNQAHATRTGAVQFSQRDLTADLAGIFKQWPNEIGVQVRSLIMSADSIRLELSMQDNEIAAQMIQRLDQLPEWEIKHRSMTPRMDQVDLSMTLSHKAIEEQSS